MQDLLVNVNGEGWQRLYQLKKFRDKQGETNEKKLNTQENNYQIIQQRIDDRKESKWLQALIKEK